MSMELQRHQGVRFIPGTGTRVQVTRAGGELTPLHSKERIQTGGQVMFKPGIRFGGGSLCSR